MNRDEARSTVVAHMSRLGMTETDFGAPRSTIARKAPARVADLPLPPITVVGASTPATAATPTADLRMHAVLGRGGMGVVHSAEQSALMREVAVKTVSREDDRMRRALVREARTVGALEHPNIVPVHTLGATAAGDPVLVMKLIDGVPWRTLLNDPNHPNWAALTAGHHDPRFANADVLLQVARAVAFAHSRGVLHRDIKPDNVMIGRFGEVYVVDWGIALRLDERDAEPDGIVGTPAYLAPEMARGVARDLDERTDVYLLGATLFEIITGAPPHIAETPVGMLVSALMSEVALPPGIPSDIAGLLEASLARDPAKRPQTAEAFRAGLARHMARHDADILIADAVGAMATADRFIAAEGPTSENAYRALVEARFGLRSALHQYDSEENRRCFDDCLRRIVERELALHNAAAARAVASDMKTPDAALLARIAASESDVTRVSTEQSARRFYAVVNDAMRTGDMAAFDALLAPNAVDKNPTPNMAPGREGIKAAFAELRSSCTGYRCDVDDVVVSGDKAACRVTCRMTMNATGREVTLQGIDILRFERGQLVERWGQFEAP